MSSNPNDASAVITRLLSTHALTYAFTFDSAVEPQRTQRGGAATKGSGRQDEQDLQDGFCLGPAGGMHALQLNRVSSSMPPYPVHPVEKTGLNVIMRIVAKVNDPNRQ
jgi:hypothetical protein